MANAACQACVVKVGKLRNPIGTLGDPFGACNNCSAFACGHHGTRDPNVPRVICVECDPSLLCASAAATSGATAIGPTPTDDPLLIEMLRGYRQSWLPPGYWAFHSVDEFRQRRPGYDSAIFEEVSRRDRGSFQINQELPIWQNLPRESKEMLILAATITRRLDIPEQHLGPLMLMLRRLLG
jgi:hypothetical protein